MTFKSYFLLLSLVILAGCSNENTKNNSSPVKPSSNPKGQLENQNEQSYICGDEVCDNQSEFCFQEVQGAKTLNIMDCGPNNEYSCTIWAGSYLNYGEIKTQKCIKYSASIRDSCHSALKSANFMNSTPLCTSERIECNKIIGTGLVKVEAALTILKCHIK